MSVLQCGRQPLIRCGAPPSLRPITSPSPCSALRPRGNDGVTQLKIHQQRWQASVRRVSAVSAEAPQNPGSPAPSAATIPRLADIDLSPVISVQGYIQPNVPAGTQASVFALYDGQKELQYVGFSKDLRASLCTVFSRRPEKCHFFRALHLPRLDQEEMLAVRTAWFEAGPPPGNKIPSERTAWQEPSKSFTISDRGKQAAAEELAKQLLVKIKSRGCKEDFIPDPDLLPLGQVDFLSTAALTPEQLERQRTDAEAAAKATRRCSVEIDGEVVPFELIFRSTIKTNGGHMFDLRVTFEERETIHRVIVGKQYYEKQGIEAEMVIERVFAFLLAKGTERQTEGLLLSSDFPINYFSVSEVHQFFSDFEDFFSDAGWLTDAGADFWRFNRTEDYGYKGGNETTESLAAMFKMTPEEDSDEN